MSRNLRTFGEWMEAKDEPKGKSDDKPKGMSFNQWLKQYMNMEIGDFADISDIVASNKELKPMGDEKPIQMKKSTIYKVSRNPESNAVTLKVQAKPDPNDPEKAAFPHASASPYHGKKFVLSPEEYEDKFGKFPPEPGGPLGGAGGLGGLRL